VAVLLSSDRPAVIDCNFVIQHLHSTLPLILIVLSRLDGGMQSVTEMLPSIEKGSEGVAHNFNCALLSCMPDMRLADAFVFIVVHLCSLSSSRSEG